jgi:hypothetical protein
LHQICHGLLHQSSELCTSELHTSTSLHSQATRRCRAETACCKHMFQVFRMF